MKRSRYFLPIMNKNPKNAEIISHQLMLRSGMIHQHSKGIYSWLPLGKKVLDKINIIIREEQNRIGAIELLMPTLQSADLWHESGRYQSYGKEMLRIFDRNDKPMLYGPTNEEMVVDIFRSYVKSYRDLPLSFYQIQLKFRDELRPRFGTMRSREFIMKDAYSFDLTRESSEHSYNKMFVSYLRIFHRMGLNSIPMRAESGPIGGDLSHEFIVLADTGETQVFCSKDFIDFSIPPDTTDFDDVVGIKNIVNNWTSPYSATSDVHDDNLFSSLPEEKRFVARGIEVGHIFHFGTKYSKPMFATVKGPDGKDHYVNMGSYGIGSMRIVPAIIESSHDEKGIIWPDSISPFDVYVINLKIKNHECSAVCDKIYENLSSMGCDVFLDDMDDQAGSKFAIADLLGFPLQIIIGTRFISNGIIEIKHRATGERKDMSLDEAINYISNFFANISR
ncbi:proline--tRNA ligase [Candidatus Liberibacter americanus]|uniref:Proline--tRNA ligase n=1 Tax=Candidatus Liberibacter americanus str. Sao Paulo TaxID=1261131 RepID=U6B7T8_9HYPH|nr:proline--tRNA ligase [Candidatus Liberibacter americanus]AHA27926.1 Prolyl-tRNA synthetase [Candidatus Liberibacter americanus str. Sao Paulo]EMS36075.1 prolyl-tRNA ligase [Candidatus Liberibacter americanus PW_SP]